MRRLLFLAFRATPAGGAPPGEFCLSALFFIPKSAGAQVFGVCEVTAAPADLRPFALANTGDMRDVLEICALPF